jgi:hypothetical protein
VHTARVAARAAIVEPSEQAVLAALRDQGAPAERVRIELGGDPRPGELVTVTVRLRPVVVPIVGRVLRDLVLTERLSVLVEGRSPPA